MENKVLAEMEKAGKPVRPGAIAKALGHPARIHMVRLLLHHVAQLFDVAQVLGEGLLTAQGLGGRVAHHGPVVAALDGMEMDDLAECIAVIINTGRDDEQAQKIIALWRRETKANFDGEVPS